MVEHNINTRNDVVLLLLDLVRPLKKHYSQGAAWLKLGNTAAHYGSSCAYMEGYARVLWGLGPLFSQKNSSIPAAAFSEIAEWKKIVRRGLINGTNPEHEEYWLGVTDYDQKMVEMAAIVNAIALAPDTLWEPLTKQQQQNIYNWLNQINSHKVHANNWRFFRIMVNMLFRKLKQPYSSSCLEEDWKVIENCYEGDGWYCDGNPCQKDYYIAFAMHYYGLLYAVYMKEEEPKRCQQLIDRATAFCSDYIYWFDQEGKEVPFGRSLTYRFAHSAFFAAMAFAGVDTDLPVLKRMLLGNLRYWKSQPVFDTGGVLSIGYQYPNLIMSERYNAPGSPYWSFKTFLILALPQEHPFWNCEEKSPTFERTKCLEHPHMIAVHEEGGHTLLYPVGQKSPDFGNTVSKYQKFVYSNLFGFSISRGFTLEEGAFDNTLAVSRADKNSWHMRNGEQIYQFHSKYIRITYEIMKDVLINSIIIPLGKGHVRLHFICTKEEIEVADGGFAIGTEKDTLQMKDQMVCRREQTICCNLPWGRAGASSLTKAGTPKLVRPFPNTNLMCASTVIPTIYYRLGAGTFFIADYFYGDTADQRELEELPYILEKEKQIEVVYQQETIYIDK